jgi:type IV pilus assembly protein PilM
MAKGVGLDAGEFEVKVVELDGSYRKPRLTKISIDRVAQHSHAAADESHAVREAESALHALKDAGVAKENVILGFPCREAVLRMLTVPFKGADNIRKMIKFEAEGQIHSHNVDDMIIDFHTIEETDSDSRVLIAAVPKPPLRMTLSALEQAGLEPEVVDLDTMGLLRAAQWCGAFEAAEAAESVPVADAVAGGAELPAAQEVLSRVVLDLGARSTRVLVVRGEQLVDMRALRIGSDSVAEEVASKADLDIDTARDAVLHCLQTGTDWVAERAGHGETPALPAAAAGGEDVADDLYLMEETDDVVRVATVTEARDRFLERLRRELVRFLTAVSERGPVEQVWATGGGSVLPGVPELLTAVFGVAPRPLDVLGRLSHNLDEDEAYSIAPRIVTAVGLALRNMGGVRGFNFRQEDLAFTKGFDRIKFPLAVAAMLAVFLVVVFAIKTRKEVQKLETEFGSTYSYEKEGRSERRKAIFHGFVGMQMNPGYWFSLEQNFPRDEYAKLQDALVETPVFDRLRRIRGALDQHFREKQKTSGYYPELRVASGLGVLVRMSEILARVESKLGRYVIMRIDLKVPPQDDNRHLSFEVALREDPQSSFRTKYSALTDAFEQDCGMPDSPFLNIHTKTRNEVPFEGGAIYTLRINIKAEENMPVFPPVGGNKS